MYLRNRLNFTVTDGRQILIARPHDIKFIQMISGNSGSNGRIARINQLIDGGINNRFNSRICRRNK